MLTPLAVAATVMCIQGALYYYTLIETDTGELDEEPDEATKVMYCRVMHVLHVLCAERTTTTGDSNSWSSRARHLHCVDVRRLVLRKFGGACFTTHDVTVVCALSHARDLRMAVEHGACQVEEGADTCTSQTSSFSQTAPPIDADRDGDEHDAVTTETVSNAGDR